MTPDPSFADRNLLFGILALQLNFISQSTLMSAMNAWVLDKTKPLGSILLAQGRLTGGQLQALDALLVQHLIAHGGDSDNSLRAIATPSTVAAQLSSVNDPDVQASVSRYGAGQ